MNFKKWNKNEDWHGITLCMMAFIVMIIITSSAHATITVFNDRSTWENQLSVRGSVPADLNEFSQATAVDYFNSNNINLSAPRMLYYEYDGGYIVGDTFNATRPINLTFNYKCITSIATTIRNNDNNITAIVTVVENGVKYRYPVTLSSYLGYEGCNFWYQPLDIRYPYTWEEPTFFGLTTDTGYILSVEFQPSRSYMVLGGNIMLGIANSGSKTELPLTKYIPDDCYTTREALDFSINGDTIILRDGVYTGPNNTNLYLNNKSIKIRSENGAANCIIDGGNVAQFIRIDGDDTHTVSILGVSVINGWLYDAGGAIYIGGSISATIDDCIFNGNRSYFDGGAIRARSSNTRITNCDFMNNTAGYGGGIHSNGNVLIANCKITSNHATNGGGIFHVGGSPIISNCVINLSFRKIAHRKPEQLAYIMLLCRFQSWLLRSFLKNN